MVSGLCNKFLQQFSFLYIHTLDNDCSHIKAVYLLYCACADPGIFVSGGGGGGGGGGPGQSNKKALTTFF